MNNSKIIYTITTKINEIISLIKKVEFWYENIVLQSRLTLHLVHTNIHLWNYSDELMVTLLPVVDSAMVTGGEGGPSPTRVLAATDTWMLPELEGRTTSCLVEGARTTALWGGGAGRWNVWRKMWYCEEWFQKRLQNYVISRSLVSGTFVR